MSKACLLLVTVVFTFSGFGQSKSLDPNQNDTLRIYVAVDGSDQWSGLSPLKEGDAGPMASLVAAVRRVPEYLRSKKQIRHVEIILRGGIYQLEQTVVIDRSLLPESVSLTIRSHKGESAVLSGGVKVDKWSKLSQVPPGLNPAYKNKVWAADIPKGVESFRVMFDGVNWIDRARSHGIDLFEAKSYMDKQPGNFRFPEGALKNWSNIEDVEVIARTMADFVVNVLPLQSVDEKNHTAKTAIKPTYPIAKLKGYPDETIDLWVENILEALDEPGEWVMNSHTRKIYYWPKEGKPSDAVFVPRLIEFIRVEGQIDKNGQDIPIENVTIEGLSFIHSDRSVWAKDDMGIQHDWEIVDKPNAFVRLRGAANCAVRDCRFLAGGSGAVRLDLYAQDNVIEGNRIHELGGSGITLIGYGPGHKDVNRRNTVLNNHVSHCGLYYWHYYGIMAWQSGDNRIAHNRIHDMPYAAIGVTGIRPNFFNRETMADRRENGKSIRWHEVNSDLSWGASFPYIHSTNNVVEYNEIHSVLQRLGDGNGIYLSATGPGNIVRGNYLHHISSGNRCRGAIRTDGWQRDTLICDNIIYKCSRGIVRKNYNHIENNYIIDCVDMAEYIGFWSFPYDEPTLGSRLQRNILYHVNGEGQFYGHKPRPNVAYTRPEDCYADFNLFYSKVAQVNAVSLLEQLQKQQIEMHSRVVDPMFMDIAKEDFCLHPDSPALKMGIKPLDRSQMGLEKKYAQKKWPAIQF